MVHKNTLKKFNVELRDVFNDQIFTKKHKIAYTLHIKFKKCSTTYVR